VYVIKYGEYCIHKISTSQLHTGCLIIVQLIPGVLISPYPNQERNKPMFPSKWREFPTAPHLAEKKIYDSSRLDFDEIAHVPDMLSSLFPSWSG